MDEEKLHVGDVGARIELDIGEDLTGATNLKIFVEKPKKSNPSVTELVVWTDVTLDETKTKLVYVIKEGDLDVAGEYLLQGYLTLGSWSGHTDIVSLKVERSLNER